MQRSIEIHVTRFIAMLCAFCLVSVVAGCGDRSGAKDESASGATEITLWTWQSTISDFVQAFEKTHPGIRVKAVNVGANTNEYMQLTNAIAAGKGLPDVVYLDNNAIQQFAVTGDLRSLDDLGFHAIRNDFTPSARNDVTVNGKSYGLPISAGPMALFYNKDVFDKAGIASPPSTWTEFVKDAELIRATGGNAHIVNDTGDGGLISSMLWQAGARPFGMKGTTLTIDMSGRHVGRFTTLWQTLKDDGLMDTKTASWSDDWYRKLDDGSIAAVLAGSWMATTLKRNLRHTAGSWRMALMPQYVPGEHANGENGGGALALPQGADAAKAKAAYSFAQWYAHGEGVRINLEQDGIPPLRSVMSDAGYLAQTDDFFGGQKTHEVIAQASAQVQPDFQYLPYMAYANSIIGDAVGPAYQGRATFATGLKNWGASLREYGAQQGFTMR